eukprot:jgi/Botrbrau1/4634/Bobra.33_2s0006.1
MDQGGSLCTQKLIALSLGVSYLLTASSCVPKVFKNVDFWDVVCHPLYSNNRQKGLGHFNPQILSGRGLPGGCPASGPECVCLYFR